MGMGVLLQYSVEVNPGRYSEELALEIQNSLQGMGL